MKRKGKILVSGLINIETTLRIEGFPLEYNPVNYPFFGVQSTVSGVGYNVAKALTALGEKVEFLSLTGRDPSGDLVETELAKDGIDEKYILREIEETAQSVIVYEKGGRRQIHVDLKDLQETPYPAAAFDEALAGARIAALCTINFSRAMLPRAKAAGIPILTDVHVLSDIRDPYNADFMAAADWLFLSNENCLGSEADMARQLLELYNCRAVVVGMGAQGVLFAKRGDNPFRIEARAMRPIVNTIGAGDALFSAFLYGISNGLDEETSLRRAVVFAGWKIGEKGAAAGFLSAKELERLAPDFASKAAPLR